MEQAKIEKIAETFKDEEFAKRIIKIKEKEELIKAFAEKDLELSTEEVDDLIQKGQEVISSGEFGKIKKALSEDELENINGGGVLENLAEFANGAINPFTLPIFLIITDRKYPFENAGYLLSTAALTALAAPTAYKVVKAAGKGIHKAGSKVYNKITGSNKTKEN